MANHDIRAIFADANPTEQMGQTFAFQGSENRTVFERLWGAGGMDRVDFGDLWNERKFWEGMDALLNKAEKPETAADSENNDPEQNAAETAENNAPETTIADIDPNDFLKLTVESMNPEFRQELEKRLSEMMERPMESGDREFSLSAMAQNPVAYIEEFKSSLSEQDRFNFDRESGDLLEIPADEFDHEHSHESIAFMAMVMGSGDAGRIHLYLAERGNSSTLIGNGLKNDNEESEDNRWRRALANQMMIQELSDLYYELDQLDRQIEGLTTQISFVEDLQDKVEEFREIEIRVDELEREADRLEGRFADNDRRRDEINDRLDEIGEERTDIQDRISSLRDTVGFNQRENMRLHDRLAEDGYKVEDGTVYEQQDDGSWTEVNRDTLPEDVRNRIRRIEDNDTQISSLRTQIEAWREQNRLLRDEQRQLEEELAEIEAEQAEIQTRLDEIRTELTESRAELEDIRNDIQEGIRNNPELQQAMAEAGLDPNNVTMDEISDFLDDYHGELSTELETALERRAEVAGRINEINAEADLALSTSAALDAEYNVAHEALEQNLASQQALVAELEAKQLELENAIGERASANEIHDENISALSPAELGRFTRFTDLREEMRDFMGTNKHGHQITFTADKDGNVSFYATNDEGKVRRITRPNEIEALNEQLASPEGEALVNRYVRITGNMTDAEHRAARSALDVERANGNVERIGDEISEVEGRTREVQAQVDSIGEELSGMNQDRLRRFTEGESFADYSAQRSAALAAGEEFDTGNYDWSSLLDKIGAKTETARTWLTDRFTSVADLVYTKNTLEEQLAADEAKLEELRSELDDLSYKEQEAANRLAEAEATLDAVRDDIDSQYIMNEDGIMIPQTDRFGMGNPMMSPEMMARAEGYAVQAVIEAQEECDRLAEERAATEEAVADAETDLAASETELALSEEEPDVETQPVPDELSEEARLEAEPDAHAANDRTATSYSAEDGQGIVTDGVPKDEFNIAATGDTPATPDAPAPDERPKLPEGEIDPKEVVIAGNNNGMAASV